MNHATRITYAAGTAIILAIAIPASAAPAPGKASAKRTPPRTVEISYDKGPCGFGLKPTSGNGSAQTCEQDDHFNVTARKGERRASVVIIDMSGQPTGGMFNIAQGSSNSLPTLICGSASGLEVSPGGTYFVGPSLNLADPGCPTPPTKGTIKITLSS